MSEPEDRDREDDERDPGGALPGSDDPSMRRQPALQRPKGTVWLALTLVLGALCLVFLIGLGLGGEPQRTGALIVVAILVGAVLVHRKVPPGALRVQLLLTASLLVPAAFAVIVVMVAAEV